jgi:hypothetical protein
MLVRNVAPAPPALAPREPPSGTGLQRRACLGQRWERGGGSRRGHDGAVLAEAAGDETSRP